MSIGKFLGSLLGISGSPEKEDPFVLNARKIIEGYIQSGIYPPTHNQMFKAQDDLAKLRRFNKKLLKIEKKVVKLKRKYCSYYLLHLNGLGREESAIIEKITFITRSYNEIPLYHSE